MQSKFTNTFLALIFVAVCAFGFIKAYSPASIQTAPTGTLTGAVTAPLYWTVTNTSIACPSATSTLIIGSAPSRNYFAGVNNDGINPIYICKGITCNTATGIRLNGPGGSYEQKIADDGYVGAYSCISGVATSTLTVTYSQ